MTSRQHQSWINRGKPWRTARPILALQRRLQGYGYTVYTLGDTRHLDAQPPERHCPYSETNWSAYQGRPMPDVVTALDIMPRTVGQANRGLPTLQRLGKQMFDDKQAGFKPASWLIGMNWGPDNDRVAVRDTWRPNHVRTGSGDVGHIHGECDSSMIDSSIADDYDPVARAMGQQGASGAGEGTIMSVIMAQLQGHQDVYLANGVSMQLIGPAQFDSLGRSGVPHLVFETQELFDLATTGLAPATGNGTPPTTPPPSASGGEVTLAAGTYLMHIEPQDA